MILTYPAKRTYVRNAVFLSHAAVCHKAPVDNKPTYPNDPATLCKASFRRADQPPHDNRG